MNAEKRNSYGLFDAPVRLPERERISLSRDDIERQLEVGAFFMGRDERAFSVRTTSRTP